MYKAAVCCVIKKQKSKENQRHNFKMRIGAPLGGLDCGDNDESGGRPGWNTTSSSLFIYLLLERDGGREGGK